ncbi:MAG TPA: cupredoxin domain-containing protein [Candidatus Limnocylindrales bacterium]|nr:cupredoxin domain-containing protein [Candidatus Limnocylindrales bacterium]
MKHLLKALALTAIAVGASACGSADAASPETVNIRIHYSKFEPAAITVPAGRAVTFVIRNDDPIDHEWLIGDNVFHARHRAGTESVHGDRADEVSLPALTTKATTLTLAAGTYLFICHFPLHEQYGMIGVVTAR